MKPIMLIALLSFHICLRAQNTGIGEQNPTAKLEVKSDGNTNAAGTVLFKNSANQRLFHMNGLGGTTFGNLSFPNPTHIIGVVNNLQPTSAHINLYSTGSLITDVSALNRIGFVNSTGSSRKFELQSYSGSNVDLHSIHFNYYNNNTGTGTIDSISLLTLLGNGNVGIGVKDPISKLDVDGNVVVRGTVSGTFVGSVSGTIDNARVIQGDPMDFLIKSFDGTITTRKGSGGLGVNYIICISGADPRLSTQASGPMIGEIRLFAGSTAPVGWAFCNGQLLPSSSNPILFALLADTYGGNGSTVFALPDLRGSVPVHPGNNWARGDQY